MKYEYKRLLFFITNKLIRTIYKSVRRLTNNLSKGENKMVKVLVVNTVTYRRNGITGVIFNLYKHIDKTKIQMDFVATDHDIEPWAKKLITERGSNFFQLDRSYSNILDYILKLAKCAKDYDVVHVHGNSSSMVFEMLAAKLAGVKKRIAHSHNTTCSSPMLDKMLRPLFYALCNCRLACGEAAGKWLFGNRDFLVINNGIDTESYRFRNEIRVKEREKLGLSDEFVIGHVGRLNEQKNQSYLLEIFDKVKYKNSRIRLILIGDGAFEHQLKEKATEMGISNEVVFTGAVDNVNELINAVDMIVMPSLYEGLPLTLVEEQANGLTCIVSDVITKEADLSGNLQFVSLSRSPDEWAVVINKESHGKSREQMSDDSIKLIRKNGYDIGESVRVLTEVYENRK